MFNIKMLFGLVSEQYKKILNVKNILQFSTENYSHLRSVMDQLGLSAV